MAKQTRHPSQAAKGGAVELTDEKLEQADGGIIAVLIGLAKDPKPPTGGGNILLGDGSVRG